MDEAVLQRNKNIREGTKYACLFMLITSVGGQIFGALLKGAPSQTGLILGLILGSVVCLQGSCKPEKGTLFQENNKMDGTAFVVILGAFLLARLISIGLGAAMGLALFSGKDASMLEAVFSVQGDLPGTFISMGLVTPVCEEIAFRGVVGRTFKKHGVWFALIMSSLLFALYHNNALQLVSTLLPGAVMFYVAMNYSLKWSILLHFIFNGVLSQGMTALKLVLPGCGWVEYAVSVAVIIIAACLMKKDNAKEKVKAFLSGKENEEGVYKASIKTVWFWLMVAGMLLVTALMLFMASGAVDVSAMIGQ